MPVKSVSPVEASDLLEKEVGFIYLDVRSVPEFSRGHPRGALNVPLLHADPATGRMIPNPDFLPVVQGNFPVDTPLLVGCLSGGRSLKAAEVLERAGYRNITNVRCGFGGTRDARGRVLEPGWAELGLPVEGEPREGETYQTLRRRVRS